MSNLILVRHGQSEWNLQNKFTGWTDVDLSPQGVAEAQVAGELILKNKLSFDVCFTSFLRRAIRTLHLMEEVSGRMWTQETRAWQLNERHYGALQGLDKKETAEKYGDSQVHIWRRSYDVPPPLLDPDDPRAPRFEEKYKNLPLENLPLGESLKDTVLRVVPYWEQCIVPEILKGKNVLISAHGNSLRALIKHLEKISDSDIADLEIPTGKPQVFELGKNLDILNSRYLD